MEHVAEFEYDIGSLVVMDAAGIALAKEDEKPILVMNMTVAGNIRKAVLGEEVGTVIHS